MYFIKYNFVYIQKIVFIITNLILVYYLVCLFKVYILYFRDSYMDIIYMSDPYTDKYLMYLDDTCHNNDNKRNEKD